ncbi:MAG: hypothetical protein ACFFCH_04430 [Promethearchaeota archaeon]
MSGPVPRATVFGFTFGIILCGLVGLLDGFGGDYGKKSPHHYLNSLN